MLYPRKYIAHYWYQELYIHIKHYVALDCTLLDRTLPRRVVGSCSFTKVHYQHPCWGADFVTNRIVHRVSVRMVVFWERENNLCFSMVSRTESSPRKTNVSSAWNSTNRGALRREEDLYATRQTGRRSLRMRWKRFDTMVSDGVQGTVQQ